MSKTIIDPVAQTFIVDSVNYPNGVFLSSISLFFRTKPTTNIPIQLYIVPTLNGYPTGSSLDYSAVSLTADKVKISESPHYLDSNTLTKFTFPTPVYINPDILYAFVVQSSSSDYTLWTAAQNDIAVPSTAKNLSTDANPTTPTKITTSPYVGNMFESQNSITWTADQTKDLMFVINRCEFKSSTTGQMTFVVPAGLPKTKYVDSTDTLATANSLYDALNISTTEFSPPGTAINYTYTTVLNSSGVADGPRDIIPGKFGTPLSENIFLNDNKGKRVLNYAANDSFKLQVTLSSTSNTVSPILSDDGLRLYTIRYNINNMGITNSVLSIQNAGTGYLGGANGTLVSPNISVSEPDSTTGTQAYVSADVVSGNIVNVYVTTEGSGYLKTPTISVIGTNTSPASILVNGETSTSGGNGLARYLTNPITLSAGNDSGDLRVFFTAYRPINTQILVYYKILSRQDTQKIDDINWQLMTIVNGDSKYSQTRTDLFEYEAAPGTNNLADNQVSYTNVETGEVYASFYQYMIKIVLASSDSTFTPFLTDLRVIALPSGTGL